MRHQQQIGRLIDIAHTVNFIGDSKMSEREISVSMHEEKCRSAVYLFLVGEFRERQESLITQTTVLPKYDVSRLLERIAHLANRQNRM